MPLIHRCAAARAALLVLLVLPALANARAQPEGLGATYEVRVAAMAPPRIVVRARLPGDGAALEMATSWPGNVPEVPDAGWPGLIRHLSVKDADGRALEFASAGARGWTLPRPIQGPLTLEYEVDYAPLAARAWPAQREAAFADADHLIVIGRSLFITRPAQRDSEVRFQLPPGWQAAPPWPPKSVASPADLTENLLAFTREPADVLSAGGFNLKVVSIGHWGPARADVRRALGLVVQRLVAMVGFDGRADYLVVLLPQAEDGGESFRASFAMNVEAPPSRANLELWGNTVAHELFHYWNGGLLKGADYASSQWFQEGFTEYAANLALVSGGLISPEQFYGKLAAHVANARKLATPLDAPGTHKGPPLYSSGALVAFTWDGMIREATRNERNLADVLRALLRDTGGARRYAWADIQAALERTAPGAWSQFHARYIHGTEPLPLAEAFARVGLRQSQDAAGAVRIEPDPAASASARQRRGALMGKPPS